MSKKITALGLIALVVLLAGTVGRAPRLASAVAQSVKGEVHVLDRQAMGQVWGADQNEPCKCHDPGPNCQYVAALCPTSGTCGVSEGVLCNFECSGEHYACYDGFISSPCVLTSKSCCKHLKYQCRSIGGICECVRESGWVFVGDREVPGTGSDECWF